MIALLSIAFILETLKAIPAFDRDLKILFIAILISEFSLYLFVLEIYLE